jgi:hypothetical protein
MDSSSLILLAKADLLALLCKNARIFITQTINEEIIFNSKDSQLIQENHLERLLSIPPGR